MYQVTGERIGVVDCKAELWQWNVSTGTSETWCCTEAKTGGGKRAHALGAWMETAGEETLPGKEVTATVGCGTVQNPHVEGYMGSYCMRAGIADRQRAAGSFLSWKSSVRNVAFMWLGKSTDFLIWSQDIQENGKESQGRPWSWMVDQPLAKSCLAFGYENKIPIIEEVNLY